MEQRYQYMRDYALAMPPENIVGPWAKTSYIHAGGIIAAGWDFEEHILLISHDGYSLSESLSGSRILRDRDATSGYDNLKGLLFHLPRTQESIAVFGTNGGGIVNFSDSPRH